jgi:SulP family sulfate permease
VIADFVAGISTAVTMAAEGIAYALLAGLPPRTGLLSCVVPPVVYALFGTSRHLSVGPVSLGAVVTAEVVAEFAAGCVWIYI